MNDRMGMMPAVWSDDCSYYVGSCASAARAYEYELTGESRDPRDFEFEKVPYWRVLSRWDGEIGEGKLRSHWAWVWVLLNGRGFLMTMEN